MTDAITRRANEIIAEARRDDGWQMIGVEFGEAEYMGDLAAAEVLLTKMGERWAVVLDGLLAGEPDAVVARVNELLGKRCGVI